MFGVMTLGIHMLRVLTFGIKMSGKVRSQFQCLEGYGQNYKVWKDNDRIPMFGKIRSAFQCLETYDENSNVSKDKAKIPVIGRIRSEFQCLGG